MARKLFLPVAAGSADRRPTADAVRKRLGGRAATEPGAGEIVVLSDDRGHERAGVVLFVHGEHADIWTEGDLVRRMRRAETRPLDGVVGHGVMEVARAAATFAALSEGQRVRYEHGGAPAEGSLVEKCRFGALVERGDGALVGVGFRRISSAE